jgi:hypothetical protein
VTPTNGLPVPAIIAALGSRGVGELPATVAAELK